MMILDDHAVVRKGFDHERVARLTPRDRRILRWIGEGKRNKQIAERLQIADKTVRNRVTLIYSQLDLTNRAEAAAYATLLSLHETGIDPERPGT